MHRRVSLLFSFKATVHGHDLVRCRRDYPALHPVMATVDRINDCLHMPYATSVSLAPLARSAEPAGFDQRRTRRYSWLFSKDGHP
jgi:hypothetical protein